MRRFGRRQSLNIGCAKVLAKLKSADRTRLAGAAGMGQRRDRCQRAESIKLSLGELARPLRLVEEALAGALEILAFGACSLVLLQAHGGGLLSSDTRAQRRNRLAQLSLVGRVLGEVCLGRKRRRTRQPKRGLGVG